MHNFTRNQERIIMVIKERSKRRTTITFLSDHLELSEKTIRRHLKQLEAKKIIERERKDSGTPYIMRVC